MAAEDEEKAKRKQQQPKRSSKRKSIDNCPISGGVDGGVGVGSGCPGADGGGGNGGGGSPGMGCAGGGICDPSLDIDAALPSNSELDPLSKKSMRFTALDDSGHAATMYGDNGAYNSSSSSVGIQQSITAAAYSTGLSGSALMAEIQHSVEQHFHALEKVRREQEEARHEVWLKYVEDKVLREVHGKLDQQHNALSGVIAHMNQLAHRLDNLEELVLGKLV